MDDIRSIIWEILETPTENKKTTPPRMEMIEEFGDVDYDDIFTDIYLTIKNLHEFYNQEIDIRATHLLESFMLESLVLLKQNPDITLVSSGPYYVKATAFTPEGDTATSIFNDAVEINSMLEIYNDALSENNFPIIDAGIGVSSYQSLQEEHHCCCEEDDECDCNCNCENDECDCESDEEHQCDCQHDDLEEHHCCCQDESDDFISDVDNMVERLADLANTEGIDSIVVNEGFYGLISDIEEVREFFDSNFQKVVLEDEDIVFYHSNIVLDEKH